MIKTDNEKEIFLRSFKKLENQIQVLPVSQTQIERMKSQISGIQKTAENLALYDPLTHALNTRAGEWLIPKEQIKGMAKIDIYDLRQANKVYGVAAVDSELHKLAYQLMSIFTLDKGDFVRRSPGSDEFRIFSVSKTPQEIRLLLTKSYLDQEQQSLLTWDFGTGRTETEAENNLQKQRKLFRPLVIRQTILESHSEIPRQLEGNNSHLSWHEFNMPYQSLVDTICSSAVPASLQQQTTEQIHAIRNIVEDIVTKEALTGTLNAIGAKWYLDRTFIQSVALTDMLDMHEGNARYGSVAIDQDLKRFATLLLGHFPRKEGFLLFRSERAGDEFKIVSTKSMAAELESRIRTIWRSDQGRGLLAWNYGVGRDDAEAHVALYRNRVKEIESMEVPVSNGKSTFIIVRPESDDYPSLFKFSEETARIIEGRPIMDLHLTVQAIRNVHNFSELQGRLEEYSSKLTPFEVKVKNIVRMNVNNQQGRLWLLAEKTKALESIYNDLGRIAREMGYESYPYKFENWLPHIKIVELPEHKSTQIKDPTFGANRQAAFTVRRFEWTVQQSHDRWELLQQFSFPQ
ncbi:MAG TPA: GGDEF domain-containing protein [Anaerolineales bacterium]|nr:GGDEF domain-containing protein [Anaerolineales bacterium]